MDQATQTYTSHREQEVSCVAHDRPCGCTECRRPFRAPHRSDCAVHNEPALPRGACDCIQPGHNRYTAGVEFAIGYLDLSPANADRLRIATRMALRATDHPDLFLTQPGQRA